MSKELSLANHPTSPSVQKVCEVFWNLESEHALLGWTVGGISVWPLLRMKLYYTITQQLGLFDAPHPALKSLRKLARIRGLVQRVLRLATQDHQLRAHWGNDHSPRYAILLGDRQVEGKDIYVQALCEEVGHSALVLEPSSRHSPSKGSIDFNALRRSLDRRHRTTMTDVDPNTALGPCRHIRQAFKDKLEIDVGDLGDTIRPLVRRFLAESRGFKEFFSTNKVDTLFLVNAYNRMSVVAGAHTAGARVVELQHGFISRFHLGYSWPGRPEVPYAPDEFWSFGRFWHEHTPLACQTSARIIGAPYVRTLASAAGERDSDLVVFTSQGVIGRRLFDFALHTARCRPDRRVVFRLHPNELLKFYVNLLGEGSPDNFSLSHETPNIFALLASAGTQVGVFSTTLLEGMALGVRTVLINLPGIDYMQPVIARGDALLVKDPQELVDKLDLAPRCRDPDYYYAEPINRLVI